MKNLKLDTLTNQSLNKQEMNTITGGLTTEELVATAWALSGSATWTRYNDDCWKVYVYEEGPLFDIDCTFMYCFK